MTHSTIKTAVVYRFLLIGAASLFIFSTCKKTRENPGNGDKTGKRTVLLQKKLDSVIAHDQKVISELTDSILLLKGSMDDIRTTLVEKNGFYIIKTGDEKSSSAKLKDLIPWGLTMLTLLVAYFGFRRNSRFKSYDFLGDVNKQIISNPQLSAFYDKNRRNYDSWIADNALEGVSPIDTQGPEKIYFKKSLKIEAIDSGIQIKGNAYTCINSRPFTVHILQSPGSVIDLTSTNGLQPVLISGKVKLSGYSKGELSTQTDMELDAKLRAFAFYKLNNFEMVLRNLNRAEWSNEFEAWQRYLVETYVTSEPFRQAVEKGLDYELFSSRFAELLKSYKNKFTILKASHPDYNSTKSPSDYNLKYVEQIGNTTIFKKISNSVNYGINWFFETLGIPLLISLTVIAIARLLLSYLNII